jgi:hypothetical protein
VRLFGPEDSAGIVSFALDGVHPHDLGTILDEEASRSAPGHHCAQPLMDHLGVPATARASFGLYSDESDIAALLRRHRANPEDFRMSDGEQQPVTKPSRARARVRRTASRGIARARSWRASATILKASLPKSRRTLLPASRAAISTRRSSMRSRKSTIRKSR